MELHSIETGYFKLDGGAMFGVVPKSLWQKSNPPDENNMCTWAMRCMLIIDGNQKILIDTGIGNKQSEHFFKHYYLHGEATLTKSLHTVGVTPMEITDVFLTHLHFDHCGGAIERKNEKLIPFFPNATYWSNAKHWHWATVPNAREKASFLSENILPIQESGQLKYIEEHPHAMPFDVLYFNGHTESMMVPKIKYKNHTVCYIADLLPSVGHIPLPYVMGYDTRPLLTLIEKEEFFKKAADNNYIFFLEHDSTNECCTVKHTEKGVRLDRTLRLNDL